LRAEPSWQTCNPSSVEQRPVRAPDGRTLDAFVAGPEDGVALLFHNGTPSSGQLYGPFVETAAGRGVRMISFSRPGYGESTRNPGRSVADVAVDAAAVLDEFGIGQCYTLGWSGGGPHALACAALLRDRVTAAATVGGLAPYGADGLDWMTGMGDENVAAFTAALSGGAALQGLLEQLARSFVSITAEEVALSLPRSAPAIDRAAIHGKGAAWLAQVFRESVRNGIWGWYDDERAFVEPWDFDISDIGVPVAVWQGVQDRNTPSAHGEWLASHIPGARRHLHPEHGHLSLGMSSFGLLLDDLMAPNP
jgi:pimeloyl-ACP methyl ester carboxylesterase